MDTYSKTFLNEHIMNTHPALISVAIESISNGSKENNKQTYKKKLRILHVCRNKRASYLLDGEVIHIAMIRRITIQKCLDCCFNLVVYYYLIFTFQCVCNVIHVGRLPSENNSSQTQRWIV